MKIEMERQEKISVKYNERNTSGRRTVVLETKQTVPIWNKMSPVLPSKYLITISHEKFPTVEIAKEVKKSEQWRSKKLAAICGVAGISICLEGIGTMIVGAVSKNWLEAAIGAQLTVFGGAYFLRQGDLAMEAVRLARRQIGLLSIAKQSPYTDMETKSNL